MPGAGLQIVPERADQAEPNTLQRSEKTGGRISQIEFLKEFVSVHPIACGYLPLSFSPTLMLRLSEFVEFGRFPLNPGEPLFGLFFSQVINAFAQGFLGGHAGIVAS